MSNNVDLNRLRETVLRNQENDVDKPSNQGSKVIVDRNGRIREGANAQNESGLSEVPQDTFATGRKKKEKAIVKEFMPKNTRKLTTEEGITGWLYHFQSELGDQFTMFAYFDGQYYQVLVIEPKVEAKWSSPHTGHIYKSGRICFGDDYNSGRPNLQDAYAKSVLWANGLSIALRTDHFPFSINQ